MHDYWVSFKVCEVKMNVRTSSDIILTMWPIPRRCAQVCALTCRSSVSTERGGTAAHTLVGSGVARRGILCFVSSILFLKFIFLWDWIKIRMYRHGGTHF